MHSEPVAIELENPWSIPTSHSNQERQKPVFYSLLVNVSIQKFVIETKTEIYGKPKRQFFADTFFG